MRICYLEEKSVNKVIYVLRPNVSEDIFRIFLKEFNATPDSEYERLVYRLANLLLLCGENLTLLYKQFYGVEYSDFSDFLEIELGLDKHLVESIVKECSDNEYLWRIDIANYETYNFTTLFDSFTWGEESILNKINSVLMRCAN